MANSLSRVLSLCALLVTTWASAQCVVEDSINDPLGGGSRSDLYESRFGWALPTSGTIRALVVLIEMEYHPDSTHLDPHLDGTDSWPAHALPNWVNNSDPTQNLLDPVPAGVGQPQAMLTRLLHDASSGNLTLLGDYLLAPTNGGVFQLNTSTGILPSFSSTILPMIDSVTNGNWSTVFGNNGVGAYDNWTLNGTVQMGEEKLVQSDTKYDHVFFIIRNARSVPDEQGRAVPGSPGSLMGHAANTYTYFGGGGHTPVRIMCHEFCHLLFGSNN